MVKSVYAPVYALVGDDSFLQLQELARITAAVGKDAQRADFDGETAALADVLDELRCYAMFGGGCAKLVVVRNADDFVSRFREQLEDYVAKPSDTGTLALRLSSLPKGQRIYKLIDKVGQVIECAPPDFAAAGFAAGFFEVVDPPYCAAPTCTPTASPPTTSIPTT